jgi:hypothetical protein
MKSLNPATRPSRRKIVGGLLSAASVGALPPRLARAEDDAGEAPSKTVAIDVSAKPISHFERGKPDIKVFGDLQFRGGLVLSSPSPNFGGWSALLMESDGSRLIAISDVGSWLAADVKYEGDRPARLTNARIGPILDVGGRPLASKHEQDAESATLVSGNLTNGTLLIGFERHHRIQRFEIRNREVLAPTGSLKLAPEAYRMSSNQGLEALAVLQAGPLKGSVVAFAERFTRGSGYHTGWVWVGGEPKALQLRDIDGFNITDAAGLPDGGLLVLERRFRWTEGVAMRIRRLAPNELRPGARLDGQILLQADMSYDIDNMEGIAVHRGARGEVVVSLISDDNFNALLQRTVFLQFTLATK